MVRAYIALGANLGDAKTTLRLAAADVGRLPMTTLGLISSLYKTAPQGVAAGLPVGNDYFNAVVAIDTLLTAPALLLHLQQLEQVAGRERPYANAPRTLDLDLLLYGSGTIESATLTVPHPRMGARAFVLVPLAEIAPELVNAEQLQAVAHQAIERLGGLSMWG